MLIIRPSDTADLDAIQHIYAHHVLTGTGTFEITPPTLDDMFQRRADVIAKGLPYLVAQRDEAIVGFAYCNWFKPRPAYRFSAENSIYIAPGAAGGGIGKALLAELCLQAEQRGVRKLIAVIGDARNAGSIGVHTAVGFRHVGTLEAVGWKFNRWLDVVLMDRPLGNGNQTPATLNIE
jgi:phosphinothricin acetyltransferase